MFVYDYFNLIIKQEKKNYMNFHAKIKNNICFLNKINDTVVTLMNTRFLGITLVHQYNQTTTNTYIHTFINSVL